MLKWRGHGFAGEHFGHGKIYQAHWCRNERRDVKGGAIARRL
jgi:hypothetical protein